MKIKFRKMNLRDIPEILNIEKQSFTMPWSSWIFLQELISPDRYYIVADAEGTIVGYAGMQWVLDEGHITTIAVKEGWRRQGIGSQMLNILIGKARELNLKFLTLEVRASNVSAINLYKKLGFKAEGVRKNYYLNPREDGIIMTLHL